ncbi:hypothetical protein AAMO2058_000241900 [Amorphochlora amoebiformis]
MGRLHVALASMTVFACFQPSMNTVPRSLETSLEAGISFSPPHFRNRTRLRGGLNLFGHRRPDSKNTRKSMDWSRDSRHTRKRYWGSGMSSAVQSGRQSARDSVAPEGAGEENPNANQELEKGGADGGGSTEGYSSEQEDEVDYRLGGYHPVQIGDVYNGKYTVHRKLGAGHFSTVWLATDSSKQLDSPHKVVALKIQKSDYKYTEAAEDEVRILKQINDTIGPGKEYLVRLLDSFVILGPNGRHVCLVFEAMAKSLLSLIKKTKFRGVPIEKGKIIAKQMLMGLDYLHSKCSVIHTDLKPENFLLAADRPLAPQEIAEMERHTTQLVQQSCLGLMPKLSPSHMNRKCRGGARKQGRFGKEDIAAQLANRMSLNATAEYYVAKISDLGNACWIDKHFSEDIQTRQYRSPEVILAARYDESCDIWSAACVLFELMTGDYLFDPKDRTRHGLSRDGHHLALMVELLGDMPRSLTHKAPLSHKLFDSKGCIKFAGRVNRLFLKDILKEYDFPEREARLFGDFLHRMLDYQSSRRATAQELLEHEWLVGVPMISNQKKGKGGQGTVEGVRGGRRRIIGGAGGREPSKSAREVEYQGWARKEITSILREKCPRKMKSIERLLTRYKNRERALVSAVRRRYLAIAQLVRPYPSNQQDEGEQVKSKRQKARDMIKSGEANDMDHALDILDAREESVERKFMQEDRDKTILDRRRSGVGVPRRFDAVGMRPTGSVASGYSEMKSHALTSVVPSVLPSGVPSVVPEEG